MDSTILPQQLGYRRKVLWLPSLARHQERAMNTSAVDTVVIELSDEYQPAEIMTGWSGRRTATDQHRGND
jgi:hypothetical protein